MLLFMATTIDGNMDRYFIIFNGSYYLGLAPCFMHECMIFFWNYIISSLHLIESMLPSTSLLPSTKCHKSFSNFLLIVDFFLFLLLLAFFKFDSDFGLSCSCYLCNSFHMNCYQGLLMYFILSCVLLVL
jgi:hypothetical protein